MKGPSLAVVVVFFALIWGADTLWEAGDSSLDSGIGRVEGHEVEVRLVDAVSDQLAARRLNFARWVSVQLWSRP